MSLINGGSKGCILTSGTDPLGWWAHTTFHWNSGPPLTVIVTYQVVKVDPKQAGPTIYATWLYSLYLLEGHQHPENLMCHHANDMLTFVKQCQDRGDQIILAGDMNEVVGLDNQGMPNCTANAASWMHIWKDMVSQISQLTKGDTRWSNTYWSTITVGDNTEIPSLDASRQCCGQ